MLLAPLLYIIAASLAALVSLSLFLSYRRSGNETLKYLSLMFMFLALHAYILTLPFFYRSSNLSLMSYGYSIGITFAYLLLLMSIRVQAFLSRKFFRVYSNLIDIITALIGIIVVSIQVYEHKLPIITEQGVILWNVNPIAAWLTGILSLGYGLVWTYLFYMASTIIRDPFSKAKMLILSTNGLFLGTAGFLIFTSRMELQTIIGIVLFLVCCIITIPISFLPKANLES